MGHPVKNAILVAICSASICSRAHAQSLPQQRVPELPSTPMPVDSKPQEFALLSRALGDRILVIDPRGKAHEGVLTSTTADSITLSFDSTTQLFTRAEVVSAERTEDSLLDGALGGALLGALLGIYRIGEPVQYLASIASSAGFGALLDAGQAHREMLYRATSLPPEPPPQPSARTVVFRIRF